MSLVIGTRFNCSTPRTSVEWERERIELLKRFTYSSLMAQTDRDFTWVLLCHPETDDEILTALDEALGWEGADSPSIVIDRRDVSVPDKLLAWREDEVFVSARLDSDDAVNVRYVERVKAMADDLGGDYPRLLAFPIGHKYVTATRTAYRMWHMDVPFYALAETGDPLTVYGAGPHTHISRRFPTKADDLPGWLWVIHGGNLKNRTYSTLVAEDIDLADYGVGA